MMEGSPDHWRGWGVHLKERRGGGGLRTRCMAWLLTASPHSLTKPSRTHSFRWSASDDHERSILTRLQQQCGAQMRVMYFLWVNGDGCFLGWAGEQYLHCSKQQCGAQARRG